jgi:(p)ppGpp synthase/HD superfamily hydrolase
MSPTLALQIATEAHKGQTDKLGNDYITHPVRVASKFDHDPDLKTVALLHDILEDTDITEDQLRKQFPAQVVDAVVVITKRKGQAYEDYLAKVKANKMALAVKLADIADNMSRLDQLTDLSTRERLTQKYLSAMKVLG